MNCTKLFGSVGNSRPTQKNKNSQFAQNLTPSKYPPRPLFLLGDASVRSRSIRWSRPFSRVIFQQISRTERLFQIQIKWNFPSGKILGRTPIDRDGGMGGFTHSCQILTSLAALLSDACTKTTQDATGKYARNCYILGWNGPDFFLLSFVQSYKYEYRLAPDSVKFVARLFCRNILSHCHTSRLVTDVLQ